jgi:hypothetical protein
LVSVLAAESVSASVLLLFKLEIDRFPSIFRSIPLIALFRAIFFGFFGNPSVGVMGAGLMLTCGNVSLVHGFGWA